MKFLLTAINAKYIHSNPAIYSLRAYAGKELWERIVLAEFTINQDKMDILAQIYEQRPEAVGFSCYIWNWKLVEDLLKELPKVLPDTDIWLGGPQVSFGAEDILRKYPQVTGIMVGEGEAAFRELITLYEKREQGMDIDFGACEGLCLPQGFTGQRELLDINSLPFPYEDLEPFANRIIYYESSRGCPYRCSYCLSSVDKCIRIRDIDVVKKELQFFLDHRVKQVKFVDRTFNCNPVHALEIWRYLQKHDNGVTNFHFEISADLLKEEHIALLGSLRPGLVQLEIGVQSVNPHTLKAVCRVTNLERLEKNVAAIRAGNNVHQHLDLIAGLPYEDLESFAGSFDRVYAMKPQQLQLGFLKVLKGSKLYEEAEQFGIRYLEEPPYEVLSTNWLSFGQLRRLKKIEELVELYYNSGQYSHTLRLLEKVFQSPFAMFASMADFFEKQNYFLGSPARAHRYGILLRFAWEWDPERLPAYKELLTYDMYLREKAKSRPDFARDITPFKEDIRDFYQTEENQRSCLKGYEGYDWKQMSKMTHLEPFFYPVWEPEKIGEAKEKPCFVLFDYRERSPLTKEARTTILRSHGKGTYDTLLRQH